MEDIQVRGKSFRVYIDEQRIAAEIDRVTKDLEQQYADRNPLFIGILNGAFMFMGDLMKRFSPSSEVAFLKASSYRGMKTTGKVTLSELDGIDLEGRDVIIVEDIVDTGNTLEALHGLLAAHQPASIAVCTLLFKPEAYQKSLPIDYVCFRTENAFLLGYGLDYDGLGRNLPNIYILNE